MRSPVTITADVTGAIIGISPNNPEYGYIRVEQNTPLISNKGWLTFDPRSALIKGTLDDLKKAKYRDGQELEGRIVIKESLIPFNTEDPDHDLKIAGNTGIICTFQGDPIYRQVVYTPDFNDKDELIQHDNGEEIRKEIAYLKKMGRYYSDNVVNGDTITE